MEKLSESFEAEINDLVTQTLRETNYRPSYFMQMLSNNGAYDTALQLVRARQASDGFTKLWELKRLDLTVEAVVIRPKFSDLFSLDDVEKAKLRLKQYGYTEVDEL